MDWACLRSKPVRSGQSERVFVKDFQYRYFIPRATRHSSWQTLSPKPRPGAYADPELTPQKLTIRTDDGEYTLQW